LRLCVFAGENFLLTPRPILVAFRRHGPSLIKTDLPPLIALALPRVVVNRRLQTTTIKPQKAALDHWHTGCKRHARPRSNRIASLVEQTPKMKAKVTTNLTSIVMLVVLTPFLALGILVSIKTAGIRNNDVLLLMLTLSSAVLSGINGFGRRTPKAVPFSTAKKVSDSRLHLSARSSNNA